SAAFFSTISSRSTGSTSPSFWIHSFIQRLRNASKDSGFSLISAFGPESPPGGGSQVQLRRTNCPLRAVLPPRSVGWQYRLQLLIFCIRDRLPVLFDFVAILVDREIIGFKGMFSRHM